MLPGVAIIRTRSMSSVVRPGKTSGMESPSGSVWALPVQTLYTSSPLARVIAPRAVAFCTKESVPVEAIVTVAPSAKVMGTPVRVIASADGFAAREVTCPVSDSQTMETAPSPKVADPPVQS